MEDFEKLIKLVHAVSFFICMWFPCFVENEWW